MRASLAESLAVAGVQECQYPKGSIVLCACCLKPLYVLTRNIFSGDKVSRTASAYRPVTLQDLEDLEGRMDAPGVAALVKHWTPEQRHQHVTHIPEPKTGSSAECPVCGRSFPRVRALESAEVGDKAYVWELVTLLPAQPVPNQVHRAWAVES